MSNRQLYIIAYDISAPRRLYKSLKILKNYAWGGQKSVFECFLTPAEKNELCKQVRDVIDEEKDYLLAVKVLDPDLIHGLGTACLPKDEAFFYVG